jgi:4-amino-4-deoxy-L-arabinose transferase-like glycosyltransferase
MEVEATLPPRRGFGRPLKFLVALVFADLGVLVLLLFVHALTSNSLLFGPIEAFGLALVFLSGGTLVAGCVHAWLAYPSHRRVVVFLVAITVATLLAHAYTINNPPAYSSETATGDVGTTFHDSHMNVTSYLTGSELTVAVLAQYQAGSDGKANCCTIAYPVLDNSSGAFKGAGFVTPPTPGSPLVPGGTATGTWTVTKPVSNITLTYDLLGCYNTDTRQYGCIMDEVFYVPEGMGMLSGEQCATGPSAPSNCHMEHPPLGPALIAAGMALLGEYNAAGWRLFPAVLGSFSIPLLFGLAWKLSGDKRVAYLASILLALDVMFFSQSSGALLDIPEVFFGLAAFFAYFAGLKWWKFDKYFIAGVLLGVAGLAKETAVFMAMALVTYILLFEEGKRLGRVYTSLKVLIVVGLVFAAGLQAYDSALASHAVPTFVQHVEYILGYGSSLTDGCPWACGWTGAAFGTYITPFDWLLYYSPVGYYVTSVSVCPNTVNGVCQGAYSYVSIGYYGATNMMETWTVYVWVPLLAYELYSYRKSRRSEAQSPPVGATVPQAAEWSASQAEGSEASPAAMPGTVKLAGFTLVLFSWTYFSYIFLQLAGRVTYPFYFVPALPAVALGAAYWTSRRWFPKWLVVVYVLMVFLFFLVYFPDKSFLPVWVRVLLRH